MAGPFPHGRYVFQGCPATTAISRAQLYYIVGRGLHFQGVPLMAGLSAGLPAGGPTKALVLFGAVFVPGRWDRTVVAVLRVLVTCQTFLEFLDPLRQKGDLFDQL